MNEKSIFNLTRDFFGIILLGAALFSVTAILSYDSQDPSYNSFGSLETQTTNKGGIVGAYLSDFLIQLFGGSSFFFPLIAFYAAWNLIRGNSLSRLPIIILAGSLFLINFCAFLHIHFSYDPYFGFVSNSGGIVGSLLGEILKKWLNTPGAYLTVIMFSAISLLAITGISANRAVECFMTVIKYFSSFFMAFCKLIVRACSYTKKSELRNDSNKNLTNQKGLESFNKKSIETLKNKRKEPIIISLAPEVFPETTPQKPEKSEIPFSAKLPTTTNGNKNYTVPSLDILDDIPLPTDPESSREEILTRSKNLEKKLADFGIEGRVVQVLPGPVITLYEFEPAPGIKVSRIISLTDDLALAMRAPSVRILAPVPGKPVVGIEIPNPNREIVYFKEIISSSVFTSSPSKLTMALGKDNVGNPVAVDLAQVPHLLIAGATGSGKSVGINALVCSILLNASPDEVQMIMIDPKMLEFSMYDGIPHLIAPVVTNPKKATAALQWAVAEMERRYKLMSEKGVRNITGYNKLIDRENAKEPMKKSLNEPNEEDSKKQQNFSYIVIVIDELADLMMVASKGVEEALMRLAQMARAAGIHLILATQRPSVDVLTGIIKANFPARISFQVTSRVDSRTILDSIGGEKLLGKGDMLFLPPSSSRIVRIHGVMVKDAEINRIIKFIKEQKRAEYLEDIFVTTKTDEPSIDRQEEIDEKYDEAVALIAREQQASISMVQRKLRVGYNRAARMIEVMEKEGVVGRSDGIKPREVYIKEIPA